jgi:hypothetical protein
VARAGMPRGSTGNRRARSADTTAVPPSQRAGGTYGPQHAARARAGHPVARNPPRTPGRMPRRRLYPRIARGTVAPPRLAPDGAGLVRGGAMVARKGTPVATNGPPRAVRGGHPASTGADEDRARGAMRTGRYRVGSGRRSPAYQSNTTGILPPMGPVPFPRAHPRTGRNPVRIIPPLPPNPLRFGGIVAAPVDLSGGRYLPEFGHATGGIPGPHAPA